MSLDLIQRKHGSDYDRASNKSLPYRGAASELHLWLTGVMPWSFQSTTKSDAVISNRGPVRLAPVQPSILSFATRKTSGASTLMCSIYGLYKFNLNTDRGSPLEKHYVMITNGWHKLIHATPLDEIKATVLHYPPLGELTAELYRDAASAEQTLRSTNTTGIRPHYIPETHYIPISLTSKAFRSSEMGGTLQLAPSHQQGTEGTG